MELDTGITVRVGGQELLTTNEARSVPAEPHETLIGFTPGVACVPTLNPKKNRPAARFA